MNSNVICTPLTVSQIALICTLLPAYLRKQLVDILSYTDNGSMVNFKKSCLQPTQQLVFLGFLIDTVEYSISFTDTKCQDIFDIMLRIFKHKIRKIWSKYLAKLIGRIIVMFSASEYMLLHYRVLDHFKIKVLKLNHNNWRGKCKLDDKCLKVVWWCHDSIFSDKLKMSLHTIQVEKHLYCDSSGLRWWAI